jgi:hypothetical protein
MSHRRLLITPFKKADRGGETESLIAIFSSWDFYCLSIANVFEILVVIF